MKRNPNYYSCIDVPFWTMDENVFFESKVKGDKLVDNVVYVMNWFKDHKYGLNSPNERVVIGRDGQGFLHVGTNYPQNITKLNSIEDLKKQKYGGICIHAMGMVESIRALDTLLLVLLRDKIISKENIAEQKAGEFDHIYKKLEQAV